jgi:DMSO/TMAO reductase YedYZ molybdopterin-dependent catalytic subunit
MAMIRETRRNLLLGAAATAAALPLAGCDGIGEAPEVKSILDRAEDLTRLVQRRLLGPDQLAREYAPADISPEFKANGTTNPDDEDYQALANDGFKTWALKVDGLVEAPASLSLAALRAMPARAQITRHDCVEGWSCIGKWTGVPLSHVLDVVCLKPEAKFIVFRCADTMENGLNGAVKFYGSIARIDAYHPQTILAYDMNDKPLPVAYGAPLRLRLERQLGYKMSKYIMRIEAVDSLANIGDGKGGYWEDRGYEWYAGI